MSTGITRAARRMLSLAVLAGAAIVIPAPTALAACHAFMIDASPRTVAEGGKVTVTVGRDGNVSPSRVDARAVNGTARSGSDFTGGQRRTISFTNETSKTFTIPVVNDAAREGAETFRVELVTGSGDGCTVNPNFSYDPPVTVTIGANDQPAATRSPSPRPRATSPPAASGGTTQGTSPTPTAATSPTATIRPTAPPLATSQHPLNPLGEQTPDSSGVVADSQVNDDGGLTTGLLAVAAGLLAAVVIGAAAYLRRRRLG